MTASPRPVDAQGLPRAAEAVRRPNVIVLLADDQRAGTIGALGNPEIRTPNLDRLAREGTAFANASIMGGNTPAICSPARAMLLTGRTLFRSGERGAGTWDPVRGVDRETIVISPSHVTLPEALRSAGYVTFTTGKHHNGRSHVERAFSRADRVFLGGMSRHDAVPLRDLDPATGRLADSSYTTVRHSSELFTDAAIEFLRDRRGDAPFFLYLPYTAPHDPRTAPAPYHAMYRPDALTIPANFLPAHPFDNGEMQIRDEKLLPTPRTREAVRRELADYYAMITHLDAQIGRLLQALEETGEASNTLVVFTSDNGLALGQHGLLGKQNLYEHSVGVPLLMRGPGVPKGAIREGLVLSIDIFPTLTQLVGVATPGTVEGTSLVPMLRDPEREIRTSIPLAYRELQRGVRERRFKLIEYSVGGTRTTQLFDLRADPGESRNLAGDPAHAAEVARLRRVLDRWPEQLGDPHPPFWRTPGRPPIPGAGSSPSTSSTPRSPRIPPFGGRLSDMQAGALLGEMAELLAGAIQASETAEAAATVPAVRAAVDRALEAVWGLSSGVSPADSGAELAMHGFKTRWQVTGAEFDPPYIARYGTAPPPIRDPRRLGIMGRGRAVRDHLAELGLPASRTPAARRMAASRVATSLNNVIGYTYLSTGRQGSELQPRVSLTHRWDAPMEFWESTADTGWLGEAYAQASNILKTDYADDAALARAHAGALTILLRKSMEGVDADGDGVVEPVEMEGGMRSAVTNARAAGLGR